MKWALLAVVALALVVVGGLVYYPTVANPRVEKEVRADPEGTLAARVMLLTLPTGRTVPVNYLREGDRVYAGADGPWWRELRGEGGAVTLLMKGEQLSGHARAIEDDPEHTREVFARLRPTAPTWLPRWLNGVLVEIRLDG